jgi:hypothetical protein
MYSIIRALFLAHCASFYGSMLWRLDRLGPLEVAWRKCLKMLFHIPPRTHSVFIPLIVRRPPLSEELLDRFTLFWEKCLSQNTLVRLACEMVVTLDVNRPMHASCVGKNVDLMSDRPVMLVGEETIARCDIIVELLKCRSQEMVNEILDNIEIDSLIYDLCVN